MTNEELVRRIKQGDTALMADLYEKNRRFINSLVRRAGIPQNDYEDAMQNAYIGLHAAVNSFDESKGCKFLTYASYRVRSAILRGQSRALYIPEGAQNTASKVIAVREQLAQRLDRAPTAAEIGGNMDINVDTISAILNAIQPTRSIYEPLKDDLTLGSIIQDKNIDFENDIAAADEWRYIRKTIAGLPEQYREVIEMHYFDGMTYGEMSEATGIKESILGYRVQVALKLLRSLQRRRRLFDAD